MEALPPDLNPELISKARIFFTQGSQGAKTNRLQEENRDAQGEGNLVNSQVIEANLVFSQSSEGKNVQISCTNMGSVILSGKQKF